MPIRCLPATRPFVRQLKEQGGYSTALFGKWHLAGVPGGPNPYSGMKPKQAGFDLFRGNMHAAIRTYWDYDYQVQDATRRMTSGARRSRRSGRCPASHRPPTHR